MYDQFNVCISDFSYESDPGDYWYDSAILEAINILKKFKYNDWELLLEELKNKPLFWQKRLAECLGDLHNAYELDVLLNLIKTNDKDLFINCIDSLRCLDLSVLNENDKKQLLSRMKFLQNNISLPEQKIFEGFYNKTSIPLK